jgi:hypothetical protein
MIEQSTPVRLTLLGAIALTVAASMPPLAARQRADSSFND